MSYSYNGRALSTLCAYVTTNIDTFGKNNLGIGTANSATLDPSITETMLKTGYQQNGVDVQKFCIAYYTENTLAIPSWCTQMRIVMIGGGGSGTATVVTQVAHQQIGQMTNRGGNAHQTVNIHQRTPVKTDSHYYFRKQQDGAQQWDYPPWGYHQHWTWPNHQFISDITSKNDVQLFHKMGKLYTIDAMQRTQKHLNRHFGYNAYTPMAFHVDSPMVPLAWKQGNVYMIPTGDNPTSGWVWISDNPQTHFHVVFTHNTTDLEITAMPQITYFNKIQGNYYLFTAMAFRTGNSIDHAQHVSVQGTHQLTWQHVDTVQQNHTYDSHIDILGTAPGSGGGGGAYVYISTFQYDAGTAQNVSIANQNNNLNLQFQYQGQNSSVIAAAGGQSQAATPGGGGVSSVSGNVVQSGTTIQGQTWLQGINQSGLAGSGQTGGKSGAPSQSTVMNGYGYGGAGGSSSGSAGGAYYRVYYLC